MGRLYCFQMKKQSLSPDQPARYRLRLQGQVNMDWSDWLLDSEDTFEENQTIVTGTVRDQAALFGLLNFIRNLGTPLLLVERITDY